MSVRTSKTINLALQGGGSHGAFSWGVLDRLLDEDALLTVEGISGTSAGAMNGAAFLQGYSTGGRSGAKNSLHKFWHGVGELASFGLPNKGLVHRMLGIWDPDFSTVSAITDAWQRMFSPYQTNPFNYNPLRDLLAKLIDIEVIRNCTSVKLFVCATNVETGRAKIFSGKELSIDALLASGCLPFTFQAVTIDGVPYWDGGYVGNPAIYPLIYSCNAPDIAIVQINPLKRAGTPETTTDIVNRVNEISFNAGLISEMRAIAFVQRLIEEDHLKSTEAARLKDMNMHVIGAEEEMRALGASSKFNATMDFLLRLKDIGRNAADKWLEKNWDTIGKHSSVDIRKMFLE